MTKYAIANTLPPVPDHRDIPYRSPFKAEELPPKIDMRKDVFEVENQLSIGSCVANGVASSCELIANRNKQPIDLSRMFLYNATKSYENRLGQEGLYTKDAYHIAYKYGMPTEEEYPYNLATDNIDPPEDIYKKAFNNRINRYENLSRNVVIHTDLVVHRIKSALYEGMPVGIAFVVTEDIYNLQGSWKEHKYSAMYDKNSSALGGHYMLIVGYDDEHQKFIVQNSWGEEWGDKGYGGFPYGIVKHPFFEAWIARSFKDMNIPERPGVRLEVSNKFRIEARIVTDEYEIGDAIKIYMGAVMPDGSTWLKAPVDSVYGNQDYMPDIWKPFKETGLIPTDDFYILDGDNHIKVVHWFDLSPYKGTEIYVGYGKDIPNIKITKLVTI